MVIKFINALCRLFFYPLTIALGIAWLYGVYRAIRHRGRKTLFFAVIVFFIVAGCFIYPFGSSRYMAVFLIPGIAYILYGVQSFRRGGKSTLLILTLLIVCAVAGAIKSFRFVRRSELPAACMRIQADSRNYQTPAIINLTREITALQFYARIPVVDDLAIKPLKAISHNQLHRLLQRHQYAHDALYFVFWQEPSKPDFSAEEFCLKPDQWQKIFRGKTKKQSLDLCIFRYTYFPADHCQKDFALPLSKRTSETALLLPRWFITPDFYIMGGRDEPQHQIRSFQSGEKTVILLQSPTKASIRTRTLDLLSAYRLDFTCQGVAPGGFLEVVLVKGDLPTKKIYKEETIAHIPIVDNIPHRITLFLWRDMIRQDEYGRLLFRIIQGGIILSDFSITQIPDAPQCDFDR